LNESTAESSDEEQQDDEEDPVNFTHLPGEDKSTSQKPELIDLDFDYFDPRGSDYHALRNFLNTFLNDDKFDAPDLATLISEQVPVGTMIKNGSADTDPLAFVTAINLYQHRERPSVKQIKAFLLANCNSESKAQLQTLLDFEKPESKKVGLLVQERLKNVPPELIPPLHAALIEDINWATENADKESQEHYDFKYFILISLCSALPTSSSKSEEKTSKKKKKKKKKKAAPALSVADSVFYKFEEQFYFQEALFWYGFNRTPVVKSQDTTLPPQTYVVSIIPRSRFSDVVKNIQDCISTSLGNAVLSAALPPL